MAYGGNLWYWKHARVGWDLGFGLLPINVSDRRSMVATGISQTTYPFDASNIYGSPPPEAPYNGSSGGTGFAISDTYGQPISQPLPDGMVTGSRTLDVMLYTVRLGPTFYWDITREIGVSLGAGPAVGIVSGDLKFDEVITTGTSSAHNSGQVSGSGVIYGGYVNATLMYHLVDNGDIYLGVQYMPMGNTTISGAGRQAQLDLGGQVYISAGINWPF